VSALFVARNSKSIIVKSVVVINVRKKEKDSKKKREIRKKALKDWEGADYKIIEDIIDRLAGDKLI